LCAAKKNSVKYNENKWSKPCQKNWTDCSLPEKSGQSSAWVERRFIEWPSAASYARGKSVDVLPIWSRSLSSIWSRYLLSARNPNMGRLTLKALPRFDGK
jgi:hypothetical protein